jgi:hypothetical protein
MAPGDAAKVIRKLAAAVQADPTAGKPARRAAQHFAFWKGRAATKAS